LFLCSSLSIFICLLCLCSEEQGKAGVRWLFVLFPCFCLVCFSNRPLCSLFLFFLFVPVFFFCPPLFVFFWPFIRPERVNEVVNF
jgi:hypothetical protein